MIVKILSWDIGIKHLAFCMIEKNLENNTFKIDKWINIDLMDTNDNKNKCCAIIKNKNKCDSIASYFVNIDKETKYYCGKHKSQYNISCNKIEMKYVSKYENKNNNKCQYISSKKIQCSRKANYLFDDCLYCCTHKNIKIKAKYKEMSIKQIKTKKCMTIDPQILCEKIYVKLNQFDYFKEASNVYIENQPVYINPIMKSVSSMIFSYFVYLFKLNNFENRIIKFVSPVYKINITPELIKFIESKIDKHKDDKKDKCKCKLCCIEHDLLSNKTQFGENYSKFKFSYGSIKELSIIYTEKILIDNNIYNDFNKISNYDKKDDLCDAFLHGYNKLI